MNDLLFNVMEVVVISAIAAVLRYIIPYFSALLREHDFGFAADIVETLVRAAEQTIIGHGRGDEKFEFVIKMAQAQCARYGIRIQDDQLIQLLEAAVQTMNQESKWLYPVEEETGNEVVTTSGESVAE